MQRLAVGGAFRPIYGSLGVKRLIINFEAYFTGVHLLVHYVSVNIS